MTTTGRINQVASSETATPTRRCEKRQHRARGIDGRKQKLGDQTRFANPTKSIGLPHSHGSMNTAASGRFRAHPGARLSRRRNCPFREKTHKHHQGNASDPTRPLEHHSRMSNAPPLARRRGSATPMPRPHGEAAKAHRRRTGKSRSGEGAPNGPAESVKDQKLELGKRVARATWAFPRARRAEGHRPTEARGKWPLHCSHAEGQAIAQSARGQQALPRRAEGATGLS
ncbi:hypothetical protein H6P81_021251 [Aristolochia fimbriata]|uniref:Uncharacterized protein n=1 Tax=Aristolochia fimbriata TaxID=158543 RepID=A0AAV7DRK9_ARIFI|nr:hypothetical protein H6P81_021251 [Aristolochia fimbriata]